MDIEACQERCQVIGVPEGRCYVEAKKAKVELPAQNFPLQKTVQDHHQSLKRTPPLSMRFVSRCRALIVIASGAEKKN